MLSQVSILFIQLLSSTTTEESLVVATCSRTKKSPHLISYTVQSSVYSQKVLSLHMFALQSALPSSPLHTHTFSLLFSTYFSIPRPDLSGDCLFCFVLVQTAAHFVFHFLSSSLLAILITNQRFTCLDRHIYWSELHIIIITSPRVSATIFKANRSDKVYNKHNNNSNNWKRIWYVCLCLNTTEIDHLVFDYIETLCQVAMSSSGHHHQHVSIYILARFCLSLVWLWGNFFLTKLAILLSVLNLNAYLFVF